MAVKERVKVFDAPTFDEDDDGPVEAKATKNKKTKEETVSKEKAPKAEKKAKTANGSSNGKANGGGPFRQTNSIISKAYSLATGAKGVKIDDILKLVKKEGGEPRRVLRILRSGAKRGYTWKVNEDKGVLRILPNKK